MNVKAEMRGWWAARVASTANSRWLGEIGAFGGGAIHSSWGVQREYSWSRLVVIGSLWSYEQLGRPIVLSCIFFLLESSLLIHRASSLPTEELCRSSRWQNSSILPSALVLFQCLQGRLEPSRSYTNPLSIQTCVHRNVGHGKNPREALARALTPVRRRSGHRWVKMPLNPSPVITASARQQERGSHPVSLITMV